MSNMTFEVTQLNKVQQEAVTCAEGPCMIIAGAGSGKTRVLTHRIAYLLHEKKVDPFHILALTFTNKAAKEMRERIEAMIGPEARNLWLGTFHSVFARILRVEAPKLGYPHHFSIYDTDDTKSLIRTIIKEMGLDDKVYKPGLVVSRISGAKNRLISATEYAQDPLYQSDDASAGKPRLGEIYLKYAERCFKAGAMDFDDLLFNTHRLFNQYLEVLYKYQERFQYILVDEFQDTNFSQYAILRDLASLHRNICVVGDDAQSIYAFRGADIQNILSFEKDYPNLKVFKLEQNYRSTQHIVNAANSIILRNKAQLRKSVWTENDLGEPLALFSALTDSEEGRLVATAIAEARLRGQLSFKDFAVLYRTNSQSRALEEALRRANIPYRIVGGLSFYQRKEVKDLLAYLRFLVNPNDEEALKRIINLPKRGIGATSIDKLVVAASDHATSLWEVLCNVKHFLKGTVVGAIDSFVTLIQAVALELPHKDAYEIANTIAQRSGLLKELYEEKTVESLSRYENVQELLNAIKAFVTSPETKDPTLGAFLQEVSLLTNADEVEGGDEARVTLMTIHASKGLEFAYVHIVGIEEGLFPSQLMLGSRAELEEERRLFYVAITRAKHKVYLSYALNRYRYGRRAECEPSRFLQEIDPQYLYQVKPLSTRPSSLGNAAGYANRLVRGSRSTLPITKLTSSPSSGAVPFVSSDVANLKAGIKVEHPKFGVGTVESVSVEEGSRKAVIQFDQFGEKTLLLNFAKLRILE